MPRGWFSGPGVGVLDARYLRLDCSNDPLTAGLEVNAATAGEPVLILQTTDDNAAFPVLEIQNAAGAMLSEIQADGDVLLADGVMLLIGTGADGELYSSADDIIFRNTTLDKEIDIFVNDGGADREIISLGHAIARIYVQAQDADRRCIYLRPAAGQTAAIFEWGTSGLGYSGSIQPNGSMAVQPTSTIVAGGINALTLLININAGAASAANYRGFFGGPIIQAGNVQNYTGEVIGLLAQPEHRGTGTVTRMVGNWNFVRNISTGTITNAIGEWIYSIENIGGGVVTNAQGLVIESQTVGAVRNDAIYTHEGLVHFGDQVEIIGLDAADVQLTVRGAAAQAGELQVWEDSAGVNLLEVEASGVMDYRWAMGDSTKDPTTDAPDDWVEVKIAGVVRYLPAYAA